MASGWATRRRSARPLPSWSALSSTAQAVPGGSTSARWAGVVCATSTSSDKYFELHLPYTLASKVFPMMRLPGWFGLAKHELKAKAAPFNDAILERWKQVKTSRNDVTLLGASLHKEKWDDVMYFVAQDYWMQSEHLNLAATSLAVMAFVRITCTRAGAMARDWFDRKGLTQLVCRYGQRWCSRCRKI